MKIKTKDCLPDGMLLTISEIFVDTHEEKNEIIAAVKNVLKIQKKRLQKELKNTEVVYDKKNNSYYFKTKSRKKTK